MSLKLGCSEPLGDFSTFILCLNPTLSIFQSGTVSVVKDVHNIGKGGAKRTVQLKMK